MKIAIVGGHKKAEFLIESFQNKGHELLVIHDGEDYARYISTKYDIPVLQGDGSKPYVLDESGIYGYDVVIALTPKDCDNLVICQLATKVHKVKKAIATISNPNNTLVFKKLGVNTVISSGNIVANIIEQMALVNTVNSYIPLENGKVIIIELIVEKDNAVCNKKIVNLKLPDETIIACILRNVETIIPNGQSEILSGDKLIVITTLKSKDSLYKAIIGGNRK